MKVIGLTGFAKSGKSTAAQILKDLGGYEVAFAKHLKDVCAIVLNIPRSHFDDQAFKEVEFQVPAYLTPNNIGAILDYFEVPKRYQPDSILKHSGKYLKSPRVVAQYVGTEVLRAVDSDIHINMAFRLSPTDAPFLICSDMRFENELLSVQNHNGLAIGISRAAATPKDLSNLHGSEAEIPDLIQRADVVFHNETTIEEFQKAVRTKVVDFLSK